MAVKGAHVPERTCAGCGAKRGRPELLRVAVVDGCAALDPRGRAGGRGAYLCAVTPAACLHRAERRRHLARTLRADHGVIDYSKLLMEIERLSGAEGAPPSPPR